MMDAKPILVIYIPVKIASDNLNIFSALPKQLKREYHCLAATTYSDEFRFETFNSPHTEIDFEELKATLMSQVKSLKND